MRSLAEDEQLVSSEGPRGVDDEGRGESQVTKTAKTDEFDVTGLRNSRIREVGNISSHVHQNDNGFPAAPACPNRV